MGMMLNEFQNHLNLLTNSELAVLNQLDNNPELLSKYNLTELSSAIASSNSTIIRCAQKLGYSGFRDFKYSIIQKLHESKILNLSNSNYLYDSLFFNITEKSKFKIKFFIENIKNSKNIFIVGLGLSKPLAEYMSKMLYQMDRSPIYLYESNSIDLLPNLVSTKDLVIFISISGETDKMIEAARKVSYTNCTVLSITNTLKNKLNKITKQNISTELEERFYHNYNVTPHFAMMLIIDLILTEYLNTCV